MLRPDELRAARKFRGYAGIRDIPIPRDNHYPLNNIRRYEEPQREESSFRLQINQDGTYKVVREDNLS